MDPKMDPINGSERFDVCDIQVSPNPLRSGFLQQLLISFAQNILRVCAQRPWPCLATTSYYRGILICADTLNTLLHALYEMDQLFAQYDALKDVALAELTSGRLNKTTLVI